ncbi:amino acid permease [Periweissella ghanensis]|uniref:D-serine/D-alanine/glycine transporter n=1 Tax=Periweissella ghanensis TaxID=467997 RepID=A0ABN8BR45_9LACO|nr:amino acid permease [Periweissella ghanensis]MCM0600375.1 amino acid permease [Periweissella ghanensis]CAH0419313.1 D-serine/D-alanine/glycine transporter [Periweissella ghanensis]
MDKQEVEMARDLKGRHIQLIALGGTIGTGLFMGAGSSIKLAGPGIIWIYMLTGVFAFLIMRALGELLLSDTSQHSFINFIEKYVGVDASYIAGWTYWVSWITIAMGDLTATGIYIQYWFPSIPQWIPDLVFLLIIWGLNSITVKAFGETEFWFAMIKIVAIIGLIVLGIVLIAVHFKTPMGHASLSNLVNHGGWFPTGPKNAILAFQMVFFAFVGVEIVGVTASETKNPKKIIPKAINDIPTRIMLFYVGSLLVVMSIYPWVNFSGAESPFVKVFAAVGIPAAAGIINFVVLTASASALNSSIFTTSRMIYALTSENNYFHKLSRAQVPSRAVNLSVAIISLAVVLNGVLQGKVFGFITSVATTTFIVIYALMIIAHLRYKKTVTKPLASDAFKMPGAPFTDYLILAFLAFIFVVLFMQTTTMYAALGTIIWFIVLILWRIREKKRNI